jgi:hypothetical protein
MEGLHKVNDVGLVVPNDTYSNDLILSRYAQSLVTCTFARAAGQYPPPPVHCKPMVHTALSKALSESHNEGSRGYGNDIVTFSSSKLQS